MGENLITAKLYRMNLGCVIHFALPFCLTS